MIFATLHLPLIDLTFFLPSPATQRKHGLEPVGPRRYERKKTQSRFSQIPILFTGVNFHEMKPFPFPFQISAKEGKREKGKGIEVEKSRCLFSGREDI